MTVSFTSLELWGIFTPLMLTVLAIGALALEMTFFRNRPRATGIFTFLGMIIILVFQFGLHAYRLNSDPRISFPFLVFSGQYCFDLYSLFFNYIFLIAAIVTVVLSLTHMQGKPDHRGEYYILITIAAVGMCMMAAAHDLLILFVGLEIMSIAVYVLVGFERSNLKSNEASIKYLLLGAFASAIFLYGMALVYGATGSINFRDISGAIAALMTETQKADADMAGTGLLLETKNLVLLLGAPILLVGLFFKIAAVPFHMWTPDVYEGAPTPVTGFMATAVKAAAFAALIRVVMIAFTDLWGEGMLYHVLYVLAILTMTIGNFVAIAQRNVKRMLAYSSIAHAGYLLVGVTAMVASSQFVEMFPGGPGELAMKQHSINAASSILFYLWAYTFMNLGAFGIIALVCREKTQGDTLEGLSGLSKKRPGLAAAMAVCMLSLTGIPPMVGFAAKFYVFQAAVTNRLYVLAVIGVLNSLVAAYYYLRVLVVMYMEPEKIELPEDDNRVLSGAYVANIVMAAVVVLMGLFPQPVLNLLVKVFEDRMIFPDIH